VQHRAALVDTLAAATRGQGTADLADLLRAAGVPCAPILDIAAVAAEPQTQASRLLTEIPVRDGAVQRTVLPPLAWDGARVHPNLPAPALNAHAAEILAQAGVTPQEAEALRSAGAIL
jgi:formyl-CoA transferase